jgi:uncharacterized membrane protein
METPATTAPAERSSSALTFALLAAVLVVAVVFAFSSSLLLPNNWYSLFKAIHVSFAVLWVGGGLTLTVLGLRAERSRDPIEAVMITRQAIFMGERVFAPAGMVVFLMGIAMMINTNWGWGKFWVIVALVGYAATFATGLGVLSPLARKINASIETNGPEHPETTALIRRILLVARVDAAVLFVVVLDMVTKPFA